MNATNKTSPSWLAAHGFTLIELLITIVIVGILAAIALPAYNDYILRGKLIEASNTLMTMRTSMEQYYQDNRTYLTVTAGTIEPPCATLAAINAGTKYFTISCPTLTAITYSLVATGKTGTPTANFIYRIDQTSTQSSTAWGASNACWIMKKGSTC